VAGVLGRMHQRVPQLRVRKLPGKWAARPRRWRSSARAWDRKRHESQWLLARFRAKPAPVRRIWKKPL